MIEYGSIIVRWEMTAGEGVIAPSRGGYLWSVFGKDPAGSLNGVSLRGDGKCSGRGLHPFAFEVHAPFLVGTEGHGLVACQRRFNSFGELFPTGKISRMSGWLAWTSAILGLDRRLSYDPFSCFNYQNSHWKSRRAIRRRRPDAMDSSGQKIGVDWTGWQLTVGFRGR